VKSEAKQIGLQAFSTKRAKDISGDVKLRDAPFAIQKESSLESLSRHVISEKFAAKPLGKEYLSISII
jgi:hypothetical protein